MPTMCCPNNPEHRTFVTTVVTCQAWVVDENGDWLETLDDCVDYIPPCAETVWECVECGSKAEEYKLRLVFNSESDEA